MTVRDGQSGPPSYDELPVVGPDGMRCSWSYFGTGDELGSLNFLTEDRVAAAMTEAQVGRRISIQLPLGLPDPPLYGRDPMRHTIFATGRNNWDDRLDSFYPQSSSQWDGFRHVRYREFGFYGGEQEAPPDLGDRLGIHHWARQGIVGRGLLLDVAGLFQAQNRIADPFDGIAITTDDLEAACERQHCEVRPGDVLCVRTGWAGAYRRADPARRAVLASGSGRPPFTGLRATEDTARWLWNAQVSAVVADNPAVECSPGDPGDGSLHRRLLVMLGIPLGELFDLEELAVECAVDGRWSFLFASVPLGVAGGVGSPANAVAIR